MCSACALFMATACEQLGSKPAQPPRLAPTARSLAPAEAGVLATDTPEAVVERIEGELRLDLDRRFLSALDRVPRLAKGAGGPVAARFESGRWHVLVGGDERAALSELPGFDELYAVVRDVATRALGNAAKPAGADFAREDLPVTEAIAVLREADKQLGSGLDAKLAVRAAHAWTLLVLRNPDTLAMDDPSVAQALAAIAVAEATSGTPLLRERAAIARTTGYVQSARALAAALPEDDPARAYAFDELDTLIRRAASDDAQPLIVLLALAAVYERGEQAQRKALVANLPKWAKHEPLAWAIRGVDEWGTSQDYGVLWGALRAMRSLAGRGDTAETDGELDFTRLLAALGIPIGRVPDEIETLAKAIRATAGGAWLAPEVLASHHASQAYSALDQILSFHRDQRAVASEAQFSADLLGGLGDPAGPFQRYARHLLQAKERKLAVDELRKDLQELTMFGGAALWRLYEPLRMQGQHTQALLLAGPVFAKRCDSRPYCRASVADVAYNDLQDLVADERLRASAVSEAGPDLSGLQLRHVAMNRDATALLAALRSREHSVPARAGAALDAAEWLPASDVESILRALVQEDPDDADLRSDFARWLLEQKRAKEALELADAYIARNRPRHALSMLLVKTMRARALQAMGRLDDAWAELEPMLPSMYSAPLRRAAFVRLEQGAQDEAIAIARRALERYPDSARLADLAQILWRSGRAQDAAANIKQWSPKLTITDWRFVLGEAFAESFAERPVEEGTAAFAALVTAHPDPQGVRELMVFNKIPLALRIAAYEKVPSRGLERFLDLGRLHRWRAERDGAPAADAWLAAAIPRAQRAPMSQWAYTAESFDLIWTFVDDPPPSQPHAPFMWLMRTAAYIKTPSRPAEWRKRLDEHYATANKAPHDLMALHLLGKVDARTMWSAAKARDERPESAWVQALAAESAGDLPRAITWYRAVMRGARANSGEMQWAANQLSHWQVANKSLALLSAEAKAQLPAN